MCSVNSLLLYRFIALLPIIFGFASVVVDFLPAILPEELGDYVNRKDVESTFSNGSVTFVRIAAFVFFLLGTVGIIVYEKISREIYLASSLVFLVSTAWHEAVVKVGYQAAIDNLTKLLVGVVIGMIYFTPLWRKHITRQ